ncbi:LysR substrate-binding domain-containing protein [Neobacillus niacini]|uniref:LysR substrate-binding domain-containing protein n=1 Tax=Neobacillus niacini TaxID=86668 RepID=UPI00286BCB8A|nr:LysR substrate-binding domain-containing protein [Neobacillus niacini]
MRQLKYFIAVAEELHFNNAAKRLNISQPPLSLQINHLEKEMGVKLFYRTKRNVELTEAGKLFLDRTYSIFSKLSEACEEASNIQNGALGQLKIGYTGLLSQQLINFFHYYRSKFPNVNVVFHQMSTADQINALNDNQIHIGFTWETVNSKLLNSIVTRRIPFVIALPSNHPLSHNNDQLDLRDFSDENFIMSLRKKEPNYYDTIITVFHKAGFTPKIFQETDGIYNILTFVAAEWGAAIVSELSMEIQKPGVEFRKIVGEYPTVDLSLTWRKDENYPVLTNFISIFKEWNETNS